MITSRGRNAVAGIGVTAALACTGGIIALTPDDAHAAKPATAAQTRAMVKALPATLAYAGIPKTKRRCYIVDPASPMISTTAPGYRFAYINFIKRSPGPCARGDQSFWVFWRTTPRGLKVRGITRSWVCYQRMGVPRSVRDEFMSGCAVDAA